jgi:O-antigen ligase
MTYVAVNKPQDLRTLGAEPREMPFTAMWVGPFILAAVTVAALEPWNYVVKGLGVLLAGVYLAYAIRYRLFPNAEMMLFIAWLAWALLGAFQAVSTYLFWTEWTRIFQIWVLLVIMSGLTFSRRLLSFNLGWYVAAAALVGAYSYLTGEYSRAAAGGEAERVSGLAVNANQFGWIMLLATVAMAYFWMTPSRWRATKHVLLALGMAAAAVVTVYSGSRKAIVGLVVFYAAWVFFCYRREVLRRPAAFLALGVLILAMIGFIAFARGTPVAVRFEETWEAVTGGRPGAGGMNRIELYKEALRLFLRFPLTGAGLDQFRVYSMSHGVAHSEYAEVLADTGFVGFVLYFSIFVVLWVRTGRIIRYVGDPFVVRVARLIRAVLVMVLLLDFGRYNFSDKPAWIIFGSFIGYASAVWQNWRALQGAPVKAAKETPGRPPVPRPAT